jgi:hypothetical protein
MMPRKLDNDDFAPPPLDPILHYRGVWLLCSTDKYGRLLKGRYYCSCLISGSAPLWAVWTVGGRFLRYYGSRTQIELDYSRLVWRRKMASWTLDSLHDHSIAERREQIAATYNAALPKERVA